MKHFLQILSFFLIMTAFSCSKSTTFTNREIEIINTNDSNPIMPLYTIDHPSDTSVLRVIAPDFSLEDLQSEHYKTLKTRLLATVKDTTNEGVGIAAPQVGISKRLVIVQRFDKEGEPYEFYPNIKIEHYSQEQARGMEGCLSVPNRKEEVLRSKKIVISYVNESTFNVVKDTVEGFTSVIFQHEVDHLQGVLYIDRLK